MQVIKLHNLLQKNVPIQYKFESVRCKYHQHRKEYCTIKKKVPDEDVLISKGEIYAKNEILITNNFEVYCDKRISKTYKILNINDNIIIDNAKEESKNYVKVDGNYVFQIKRKYITWDLIIHLADITINDNIKSIGMDTLYPYYIIIIYIFA